MNFLEVQVTNFCGHKARTFAFPKGFTVVVAPNGAGKSSLVCEPVAWGLWGRTIRGGNVRPRGAGPADVTKVSVVFEHEGLKYEVLRTTTGKKTAFRWAREDQDTEVDYGTNTKAQEALEAEIGSYDLWAATSMFTGDDAAMFTRATDAERKRLLEKLLGLTRLDEAALAAGKIANTSATKTVEISKRLTRLEGEAAGLESALAQLTELSGGPTLPSGEDLGLLTTQQKELQDQSRDLALATNTARVEIDQARRSIVRVVGGKCVACQQPVPEEIQKSQQAALVEAEIQLKKIIEETAGKSADISKRLSELTTRIQNAREVAAQRKASANYGKQIDDISDKLGNIFEQRLELEQQFQKLEREREIDDHVARTLGPRGVRSNILQKSLSAITKLANSYLTWLTDNLRILISPTTTTATGSTTSQFSISIEGTRGETYASLSMGERRRIDVALILALAQLGRSDMLIADDLLDALNLEGVGAVCRLLANISERRSVVLLTHTLHAEVAAAVRQAGGQVITP